MNKFREFLESIPGEWKTGLSIALAIILVFSMGNIAGSLTNINATPVEEAGSAVENTVATDAPTEAPTAAPTTQAPTAAPTTQAPVADSQPADTATSAPAAQTPSTGAPATTEEIVALFNESANKIKTTAVRATRNYQDMRINQLQVPSALQALADGAIEKFVKPNMTPEVYEGPAVAEKYPVSGTDFASKLKPEYLDTITCTDNGTEYVIDIKMKDQKNPVYRSGEGVGSIFWTMNIEDIANNAPGFESGELSYYNCTATAKIDKATGNMTYSKFIYNFDMDVKIKMIVSLQAIASLTVEEEYVIEY
ncbi:MAG: hypothetical protein IKK60_03415 [Clostridia bacterium]|nr:hypothetical protein [Clostridia bacterium]